MVPTSRLLLPALLALAAPLQAPPLQAGPAVCTTTLEAPPRQASGAGPAAPVEVTRCGIVQTVPELVQRRFFSYSPPFAEGVSLTGQITSLFGIAMGGGDGRRVMGLGFPDQTIIWDGTAIQNTTEFLIQQQSEPMPWRTGDLSSGFSGSLSTGQTGGQRLNSGRQDGSGRQALPVQSFR
jgi:hypothetical protein